MPENPDTRSRPRTSDRALVGLLAKGLAVAVPMFGIFAAHAFLSEATYETTAQLTLDTVPGMEAKVPAPLSVLRELQNAALDQATLDRLVNDRVDKSATPKERDEEAHRIRQSFAMDTRDGRVFGLTCHDSDATRATNVCNLLGTRALRYATRPVQVAPDPASIERQERMAGLLSFLAQHPEVASVGPGSSTATEDDTVAKALLAERAQIESQLRRLSARAKDNPYADPASVVPERTQLERRLSDIATILTQRRKAAEQRDREKPKVDPAVEAELLERLEAVQSAPPESEFEERPRFTATFAKAVLPLSPIKPDRPRVLLVGALVGLAAGIIFVVGRVKVAMPRRSRERDSATKSTKVTQTAAQPRSAARAPREAVPLPAPEAVPAPPVAALPENPDGASRLLPPAPGTLASAVVSVEPARPDEFRAPLNPAPVVTTSRIIQAEATPPQRSTAQPKQVPAPEVFERPRQIVEVEAVTIERGGQRYSSVPAPDMGRGRKTTQILGTPPSERRAPVQVESEEGTRPLPDILHLLNGHAHASNGASPPYQESAPPPPREPDRAPRSSAPPSGRVFVTALPPPLGWQVDPSLDIGERRKLARTVLETRISGCFVVGVTGFNVETKGRVATELALALAEDKRVLLLEGDFQVPTIHQNLRLEMSLSTGYSHQLRVRVLDEHGDGRFKVIECTPTLHVLAEGVMRSPGMILSREFEDSVIGLRAWYDVIVLNGPPTSSSVDLQALASVTDGVVLVGSKQPLPAIFNGKPTFVV